MRKPFEWLNEHSRNFLERGYLTAGETPESRLRAIAEKAESYLNIGGFADKFYDTRVGLLLPVHARADQFWQPARPPISCFNSHLADNMASILYTQAEVGMMSKYGGGTSGYFGDLRPRGAEIRDNGQSSGAVHFMKLFETIIDVVSQGSTRRGHFAPYLPVEHPDIEEFLNIGTEGNPIQELTHGVTVTDEWMRQMIAGDANKRAIWAKILQRRIEIGYPYILFVTRQ